MTISVYRWIPDKPHFHSYTWPAAGLEFSRGNEGHTAQPKHSEALSPRVVCQQVTVERLERLWKWKWRRRRRRRGRVLETEGRARVNGRAFARRTAPALCQSLFPADLHSLSPVGLVTSQKRSFSRSARHRICPLITTTVSTSAFSKYWGQGF